MQNDCDFFAKREPTPTSIVMTSRPLLRLESFLQISKMCSKNNKFCMYEFSRLMMIGDDGFTCRYGIDFVCWTY